MRPGTVVLTKPVCPLGEWAAPIGQRFPMNLSIGEEQWLLARAGQIPKLIRHDSHKYMNAPDMSIMIGPDDHRIFAPGYTVEDVSKVLGVHDWEVMLAVDVKFAADQGIERLQLFHDLESVRARLPKTEVAREDPYGGM